MNELTHGPGKGDKDRSPGWRKHYESIDWQRGRSPDGFRQYSTGKRKIYRNPKPPTPPTDEAAVQAFLKELDNRNTTVTQL